MDKRQIIDLISKMTRENGKPPGQNSFERQTGIKRSDWFPHFWLRWGDALADVGLAPNSFGTKFDDETIILKYIGLVRELNRIPIKGEFLLKNRADKSFPSYAVFERFGDKRQLIDETLNYCRERPEYDDIVGILGVSTPKNKSVDIEESNSAISVGFVYLMKSGPHYKIGRTNSLLRRGGELSTTIPIPPKSIHSIETDDPAGVEAYWHRRFNEKRGEGEWFKLNPEDVKAFKRWKRLI